MVGAGDIVADGLGAVAAQEHGAGMADVGENRLRRGGHDLQMFGGDAVGECGGLVPVADQDDGAMAAPALAGDRRAGQVLSASAAALATAGPKVGVVGDEHGLRLLVMFGLGQQVEGEMRRVIFASAMISDFRGAGDGIDPDLAENLALGLGDIGIAGADDGSTGAISGGAIGERGHRLRAADAVNLVDAGAARRPPAPAGSARHPASARTWPCAHTPATLAGIAFISTEEG